MSSPNTQQLNRTQIAELRDYFKIEADKLELDPEHAMPYFRQNIERQMWATTEDAKTAIRRLLLELKAKQTRPTDDEETKVNLTVEEKAKALIILTNKPLEFIDERLGKLIVHEERNRKVLLLSKLGVYGDNPTHDSIKGESSIGKHFLANTVLEVFPPEDIIRVSRVTGAWLERMKDRLKHKIFFVQQFGGAEAAANTFHVMLTEHGLSLGVVEKIDGRFEPVNIVALKDHYLS